MKLQKRNFSRDFKIQVCEEIESKAKTQAQASREYNIGSNLISQWQAIYRKDPINCFEEVGKYPVRSEEARIKALEAALGRATLENQILKEANLLLKKWHKKGGLPSDRYSDWPVHHHRCLCLTSNQPQQLPSLCNHHQSG